MNAVVGRRGVRVGLGGVVGSWVLVWAGSVVLRQRTASGVRGGLGWSVA